MMVNPMNNTETPWQSTIPNQLPWLNPIASSTPMQFGQASFNSNSIQSPPTMASPLTAQIAPSQVTPTVSNLGLNNPFVPHNSGIVSSPNGPPHTDPSCFVQSGQFESPFLTQLPHQQQNLSACFESQSMQHKRSSFEMEDELTVKEAPPTKQQLSESRLFKRFGSLHLDNDASGCGVDQDDEIDSDDSDDGKQIEIARDRNGFDRYVYLLFKDKKSDNLFNDSTSRTLDRLRKEERDKLSKAVILWTPPAKNCYISEVNDSDDDEDITYTDHKDFLKKNSGNNDSIIITEIEEDASIEDIPTSDDMMQD